jgi:hypothetical protein
MIDELAMHYVLDEAGEPRAVDLLTWALWLETADRVVLQASIDRRGRTRELPFRRHTRGGGCEVSTVFLGLNHAFAGGPPVLWETMIFGGPLDGAQQRYRSRLDALLGHAATVARVQAIGPRLPRRLKRALKKHDEWSRRLSPSEARLVARFARRLECA